MDIHGLKNDLKVFICFFKLVFTHWLSTVAEDNRITYKFVSDSIRLFSSMDFSPTSKDSSS